MVRVRKSFIFFFNDTATTKIYTLSLHDALPIFERAHREHDTARFDRFLQPRRGFLDRKSTRLNSSHLGISYAVFCLKKTTVAGVTRQMLCKCRGQLREIPGTMRRGHSPQISHLE